jgi:hypothetical protein
VLDSRGVVAKREKFESLLQALRVAWLRGCAAAAQQYQAAEAERMTVSNGGSAIPRRAVFRAPQGAPSASPATLELDWSDLCPRRWMRPASLSISFDCELRQQWDQSWQLIIVGGDRKSWWWGARPRHRVEIEINGQRDGGVVVRFDGHLWRKLGPKATEQQP